MQPKASTKEIPPIKILDDKQKAPARFFHLAGASGCLSLFHSDFYFSRQRVAFV
jgi:hypothetical protein